MGPGVDADADAAQSTARCTSTHAVSKAAAMSGGYSSTLLVQSPRGEQTCEALRILEECRKQREQQGSLLRQADQCLEAARQAQQQLRVQGIRRIGGVPTAGELATDRSTTLSGRLAAAGRQTSPGRQSPPRCRRGFPSSDQNMDKERPLQMRNTSPAVLSWAAPRPCQRASPKSQVDVARKLSPPAARRRGPSPVQAPGGRALPPATARSARQLHEMSQGLEAACRPRSPANSQPSKAMDLSRNSELAASAEVPVQDIIAAESPSPIERLMARGLLVPKARSISEAVEFGHIQTLFSAQVPNVEVFGIYRVENPALTSVFDAVRGVMITSAVPELKLWHGTTTDCVHNIVAHGFNRGYSGRHGTKLGHGTYFSANAAYSLRFCSRKPGRRRVMLLSKVLVGSYSKGSPDLIEAPFRDTEQLTRYDATVDDMATPTMYCIFRDYQAVPAFLVEFAGCAG